MNLISIVIVSDGNQERTQKCINALGDKDIWVIEPNVECQYKNVTTAYLGDLTHHEALEEGGRLSDSFYIVFMDNNTHVEVDFARIIQHMQVNGYASSCVGLGTGWVNFNDKFFVWSRGVFNRSGVSEEAFSSAPSKGFRNVWVELPHY